MDVHHYNIAVLASGSGTTFENLVATEQFHGGKIVLLIVDRPCFAQQRAEKKSIDCFTIKDSEAIFDKCRNYNISLVCCAGWLRKLKIPLDFQSKVMNIHPSLLPAFAGKGMHGMNVHNAVYQAGVKITGCTVHFVDDEYDTGPIIIQKATSISNLDTPHDIQAKVKHQEDEAYPQAIKLFLDMAWEIQGQRVIQKTSIPPALD